MSRKNRSQFVPNEESVANVAYEEDECITVKEDEKPILGKVDNCDKLNVREYPNVSASVLCTLVKSTEVMIVESESTEMFYKVYTTSGVNGFCMKDFITITE